MEIIFDRKNNWPFLADFNDSDEDGAVRGFRTFTTMNYIYIPRKPIEGQKVWLSDGDVEMRGVLRLRDGYWVAIPDEDGFKDVDENAPYHNNNLT